MPHQVGTVGYIRTSAVPDSDGDLGPLPEGWEERTHTDGRIFFIDHSTYSILVKIGYYFHMVMELWKY